MRISFRKLAHGCAQVVGSPWAFVLALGTTVLWAITGPHFHYSDTWQLVINTGTSVSTFLVVFLIQNTQNRDAKVMHMKLDELIRAQQKARNVFADLENASEDELKQFAEEFKQLRERGLSDTKAAREAAVRATQE